MKRGNMKTIIERQGTKVSADGIKATIPNNISMLSVFNTNALIPNGDYREDGFIYVKNKPIKKWFKKINDVNIWFPILDDIHKLQDRFYKMKETYKKYLKSDYSIAYNKLEKVKKAHAFVNHNYQGNFDPWWLFTVNKWIGHEGISWDWVKTPQKPINVEIGNEYYKAEQRLIQIGSRVSKFRTILEYAIKKRISDIKGEQDEILQLKVGEKIYWFKFFGFSWEKLSFPEDELKVVEI